MIPALQLLGCVGVAALLVHLAVAAFTFIGFRFRVFASASQEP